MSTQFASLTVFIVHSSPDTIMSFPHQLDCRPECTTLIDASHFINNNFFPLATVENSGNWRRAETMCTGTQGRATGRGEWQRTRRKQKKKKIGEKSLTLASALSNLSIWYMRGTLVFYFFVTFLLLLHFWLRSLISHNRCCWFARSSAGILASAVIT